MAAFLRYRVQLIPTWCFWRFFLDFNLLSHGSTAEDRISRKPTEISFPTFLKIFFWSHFRTLVSITNKYRRYADIQIHYIGISSHHRYIQYMWDIDTIYWYMPSIWEGHNLRLQMLQVLHFWNHKHLTKDDKMVLPFLHFPKRWAPKYVHSQIALSSKYGNLKHNNF